jgi:hypothetical protein
MRANEKNLTGVWHGLCSYQVALEPAFFVATLVSFGDAFNGTTHEAALGRKGAPLTLFASVDGGVSGRAVHFAKTYDGTGDWRHTVNYAGTLSADVSEIEGTWSITNDWSGRFLMMRAAGMSEEIIREVYERV